MADADRTATHALTLLRDLQERPYDFGFFQAVRRIENLYRDKPRTGASSHASDDPVRLVQEPTTAFAPSTLASFTPGEGKAKPRLSSYFFGLLGPNGPLPLHLTEYGRDRLRNAGDATFVRFLDLFHHRLLSLFYRAWAINHRRSASTVRTTTGSPPMSARCSAWACRPRATAMRFPTWRGCATPGSSPIRRAIAAASAPSCAISSACP